MTRLLDKNSSKRSLDVLFGESDEDISEPLHASTAKKGKVDESAKISADKPKQSSCKASLDFNEESSKESDSSFTIPPLENSIQGDRSLSTTYPGNQSDLSANISISSKVIFDAVLEFYFLNFFYFFFIYKEFNEFKIQTFQYLERVLEAVTSNKGNKKHDEEPQELVKFFQIFILISHFLTL